MAELSLEYSNQLSSQIIFISALLGGFTLTVLATLLSFKTTERIYNVLFKTTIIAAVAFLVSIYAMTKIMMMTTKGYPLEFDESDILVPRTLGSIAFMLGTLCLFIIVALAGWAKSRKVGIFATIIGALGLILTFLVL